MSDLSAISGERFRHHTEEDLTQFDRNLGRVQEAEEQIGRVVLENFSPGGEKVQPLRQAALEYAAALSEFNGDVCDRNLNSRDRDTVWQERTIWTQAADSAREGDWRAMKTALLREAFLLFDESSGDNRTFSDDSAFSLVILAAFI